MRRKLYARIGLSLMAVLLVFAITSFLRENWTARGSPGAVERFLAGWLLDRARNSDAAERNPLPATPQNLEAGRELYGKQCAFCHGAEGRGQSANGLQFYPPVPSLLDESVELTDGQINFVVREGIRYTAMPSFAKVLNSEQIWQVVLWVRELRRAPFPQQVPTQTPAR